MRESHTEKENMQIKSVYHSLESIFNVLKMEEYKALPEVQELMSVFGKNYKRDNRATNEPNRKPFIVVEGLDASGKTVISNRLAETMCGVMKGTPPECLLPLRNKFDAHPVVLKRAYYGLGNYLASLQVETACREKPVVMDRFWHSTAAYAVAQEIDNSVGEDGLPPKGDPIYNWPQDLTKPDIVLFLTVNEEVRNERLARRSKANTAEEKQLSANQAFRSIVLEAYKRMNNPSVVAIDSSRTVEETLEDVLKSVNHLSFQ